MNRTHFALAVLAQICLTAAAQADSSRLLAFFSRLEGHWEGKGSIHLLDADGNPRDVGYEMEIRSDRSDEGVWTIQNQVTEDSGATSQHTVTFAVRGDLLFVSSNGPAEPVQVAESTPTSLTYKIHRVDVMTGRELDFTFHTELGLPGSPMAGHNTVETNGVTITDETFTARRW